MQDCMGSLRNLAVPAPYRTAARLSPTMRADVVLAVSALSRPRPALHPVASAIGALSVPGMATTREAILMGGPSGGGVPP